MTDHAFELRFHAAIRGYVGRVSSDLDPVELASRIAAAQPRRRGFAGALRVRRLDVRGGTWALLLLAGLLAALVGGTLLVGSQLSPRLPAVLPPVDPAFVCPSGTNPDEPGPVDQARPPGPSTVVLDRRAGRLVALAVTDWPDGVETWTFDVCTNTWTQMRPNREPPGTEDGRLVYDVDSDVTILVADRKVWAYDLEANTWTERGAALPGGGCCAVFVAYDPLTGLVVAATSGDVADRSGLWHYNVNTDTWTPVRQASRLGSLGYGAYAYDASADRIVEFARWFGRPDETWLLDIRTGTRRKSDADTPDFWMGLWAALPGIAYDEAAQRTVVSSFSRLAAYDATADRWEILLEADPGESLPLLTVYDPVNRRLVGWGQGGTVGGAVVAFDLETREWTVLLDWSEEQPAPLPGATMRPTDLIEGDPPEDP